MTNEEQHVEKGILAGGSVKGSKAKVKLRLGTAQAVIRFDLAEDVDEHGLGDVDYLMAGLLDALAHTVGRLTEQIEADRG